MSVFTSTTKRGTKIRLTGKDASNFFNEVFKDLGKDVSAADAEIEVDLLVKAKLPDGTTATEGGAQ